MGGEVGGDPIEVSHEAPAAEITGHPSQWHSFILYSSQKTSHGKDEIYLFVSLLRLLFDRDWVRYVDPSLKSLAIKQSVTYTFGKLASRKQNMTLWLMHPSMLYPISFYWI